MLYENEILKVASFLVELIAFGAEFEEVTGCYGYSLEEMLDACRFIELTPFNVLMEMLEEAALLREEEQALWEVWAEHCF